MIPIPRVDLSPHDLTASRDELISKHRARLADLVARYPELGDDLAAMQALEDPGLGMLAVPRRFAHDIPTIGYILALKYRISELDWGIGER
ncbi:MAG: hypothetical protein EA352_10050 [Gemmatimonadales bacterium]|nr:MAG: hypothetical protein EA352_10050 [Gemmatimonadales bacterium]